MHNIRAGWIEDQREDAKDAEGRKAEIRRR